eukprot:6467872-Pyramimonas_sp.AAC.1
MARTRPAAQHRARTGRRQLTFPRQHLLARGNTAARGTFRGLRRTCQRPGPSCAVEPHVLYTSVQVFVPPSGPLRRVSASRPFSYAMKSCLRMSTALGVGRARPEPAPEPCQAISASAPAGGCADPLGAHMLHVQLMKLL